MLKYDIIGELLAGFEIKINSGYLSAPVLIYMVGVTFSGLFSLRIGAYYALEARNTIPASLLYSAKMLTSLAPALLFNYLKVCHISNTHFEEFMKRVRIDAIYLVPCIITIVMIINQWGLWSRIMLATGMEELALTVVYDEEKVK